MKLGTSTPKADPSGDYAWEVFRKAEAIKPGAFATLEKKALQLTGGPSSPHRPPAAASMACWWRTGKADIFLTYCTNALAAQRENPGQQIVALPEALAVGADYGLTVMNERLAERLSPRHVHPVATGQRILASHGFAAPRTIRSDKRRRSTYEDQRASTRSRARSSR